MANKNPSPATRFQPGNKSSHARAKGERDRISSAFLKAYADEFEKSGVAVFRRLVEDDPATFAKIGAALLPKEHEHRHILEGLDDAQLAEVIEGVRVAVAERAGAVH